MSCRRCLRFVAVHNIATRPWRPSNQRPVLPDAASGCMPFLILQSSPPNMADCECTAFARHIHAAQVMHVAALRGNQAVMAALLEAGLPAAQKNAAGWLPVHEAAQVSRTPMWASAGCDRDVGGGLGIDLCSAACKVRKHYIAKKNACEGACYM
jgi:hypothetical protein